MRKSFSWAALKGLAMLAIFCPAALTGINLQAEESADQQQQASEVTTKQPRSAMGVGAGVLSGLGFVYRSYSEDFGSAHQFGGALWGGSDSYYANFGYQNLQLISASGSSAFWAVSGAGVFINGSPQTVCEEVKSEGEAPCYETFVRSHWTYLGAGLGFEYGAAQGLTIALELPLVVAFPGGNQNGSALGSSWWISPIPAIAVLYRM